MTTMHTTWPFLRRCFRALVRVAVRHGVRIQEATDLLKVAFVEAAIEELESLGAKVNVSKVAAMTGLQRRDVAGLLERNAGGNAEQPSANLMTRVLGLWQSGKRFQDGKGSARELAFDEGANSFVNLVQEISTDLNPYTVLFELERLGLVKREGPSVILRHEAFDVRRDLTHGLDLLSGDVERLVATVGENLNETQLAPNLHITTSYDNLSSSDMPAIRAWVLERGAKFHKEVRTYLSKFDLDLNPRRRGATTDRKSFSLTSFAVTERRK